MEAELQDRVDDTPIGAIPVSLEIVSCVRCGRTSHWKDMSEDLFWGTNRHGVYCAEWQYVCMYSVCRS